MPLPLHRIQLHATKAFRLLYTGIPSISTSVPFESDLRILATSSVHISILCSDTAEGLAIVPAHYDEAYILGNKSDYLVHCSTGGDIRLNFLIQDG